MHQAFPLVIRPVKIWLYGVVAMILLMVAVGGLTRLTESGLSIVEWRPITGTLPPLSQEAWLQEFAKYQGSPQFQKINHQMSLDEFKTIFWWEYFHRLLGRMIGLVYAIPFLIFFLSRRLTPHLTRHLFMALVLGGLQGALGWYMVKSGLVDMPRVSHYRLAAHLGLALFLMCYLYWVAVDIGRHVRTGFTQPSLRTLSQWTLVLVSVQIGFGALTAGLRAGLLYNTFPLMHGYLLPPGWNQINPTWLNFFENPVTVQLIHRTLGWGVLLLTTLLWVQAWRWNTVGRFRRGTHILWGAVLAQFALGVATLVLQVPIALASLHQIGACVVLLAAVYTVHAAKRGTI